MTNPTNLDHRRTIAKVLRPERRGRTKLLSIAKVTSKYNILRVERHKLVIIMLLIHKVVVSIGRLLHLCTSVPYLCTCWVKLTEGVLLAKQILLTILFFIQYSIVVSIFILPVPWLIYVVCNFCKCIFLPLQTISRFMRVFRDLVHDIDARAFQRFELVGLWIVLKLLVYLHVLIHC